MPAERPDHGADQAPEGYGALARPVAAFACDARASRRRTPEAESALRTPFQRDRDRIIHSTAFRRLKYKTQVFVYHEGDHYRTRLTHSIEVAQIARTIARALLVDEDLAEALALAHDLGHTPFGHAGEEALDAVMRPYGGFDHNAQTLRILTRLEHRYAEFDGLNLTWETLEGVVKHNGPLIGAHSSGKPLPAAIVEYNAAHDLALDTWPGIEAQIAALADDIAYNNHDIDDGLRAGLFTVADLAQVPLAGAVLAAVRERYPGLAEDRLVAESIRRLIDRMVADLLTETRGRLAAARPASAGAVRRAGMPLVAFSPAMGHETQGLRRFLFERMYRHERVTRSTDRAKEIVRALFERLFAEVDLLPPEWASQARAATPARRARLVADYIAGMTDRFAITEHARLYTTDDTTL
jgi:dGTPase